jgi:hypothetical protein
LDSLSVTKAYANVDGKYIRNDKYLEEIVKHTDSTMAYKALFKHDIPSDVKNRYK